MTSDKALIERGRALALSFDNLEVRGTILDLSLRLEAALAGGGELAEANARLAVMAEALRPFGEALKGNYSHQKDHMKITAGFGPTDQRFTFTLGDFRAAACAIQSMEGER